MKTANTTPHSQREGSGCYAKPTPANCGFFQPVEITDEFTGEPRLCFFYEDKGRDYGFPRWRVCFYYASHLALTRFFESEAKKNAFLATLLPEVTS